MEFNVYVKGTIVEFKPRDKDPDGSPQYRITCQDARHAARLQVNMSKWFAEVKPLLRELPSADPDGLDHLEGAEISAD